MLLWRMELCLLPFRQCLWWLSALQRVHTSVVPGERKRAAPAYIQRWEQLGGCGCTWAPWHTLGWGLHPFPFDLLPVHSSAQCCGYAHMHLLHRCTGGLLLLLLELLSALCIKQFSSSCFLLSFLLCLKLPPVPLHCQLPLCLFLLNSFFHLGFFFTKQTSSSSLCSLSTL